MGKSRDWTFEDMVGSLFFSATLTGHRGDVKKVMLTDSIKQLSNQFCCQYHWQ